MVTDLPPASGAIVIFAALAAVLNSEFAGALYAGTKPQLWTVPQWQARSASPLAVGQQLAQLAGAFGVIFAFLLAVRAVSKFGARTWRTCARRVLGRAPRPELVGGEKARPLADQCPTLHKEESPPLFMSSGAFQLLVCGVFNEWQEWRGPKEYTFQDEVLEVRAQNGMCGDVMVSWLDGGDLPHDAPIVLITPGLNCSKYNLPSTGPYAGLIKAQRRVAVFLKRGLHQVPLRSPVCHLFGDPHDLERAVSHVHATYPHARIDIVAYSSGNGLAANHAMMFPASPVRSYALLCGGADYDHAFTPPKANFRSSLLLDGVLLPTTKSRLLQRNRAVLEPHDPAAFAQALQAKTMKQLYDVLNTRFSGCASAAEAYARYNWFEGNTPRHLCRVEKPILWVNTLDDPVMPGGPPPAWLAEIAEAPWLLSAVFQYGSHLPCYKNWRLERWVDDLMLEWLAAQA